MNTSAVAQGHTGVRRHDSLQAGLDLIDQGFTLIDENLQLVAWNKAFLRLLGFPEGMGFYGASFDSFIRFNAERGEYGDGDLEEAVRKRVEAARAFLPHDIERVRPDGTTLRIRGFPMPGHGFATLYSDVTQERHSEVLIRKQNASLESRVAERTAELTASNEQLREALRMNEQFASSLERSEAQMRLITDSIPALIAYFDSGLVYRFINRGYRDWFGIDPSQPQRVSAREFLGIGTYSLIKPYIKQALHGVAVTFEYEITTIGGVKKLARTTLIPEMASPGEVIGCFELTFDITQERRSHEMLVQAQKMEALGQLTGGLSHDFNNILTIVLGNLAALSEQPDVKHHVAEFLDPAMEAARRGSDLIKGLLSFSRQHPMSTSLVDIDQCVQSIDKLVRHTLPETLSLVYALKASPALTNIDANQLQNALLNLILNAKDATESRGKISVETSIQTLDAHRAAALALPIGKFVRVSVQDDGCGMDSATRARVFEPFFTTKNLGQGSGLGMSMVYGFARQSGGTIEVISEPGDGTDVALWLPLHEPTDSATLAVVKPHMESDLPTEETSIGLALLVDDDAHVRRVIRRHLLEMGYSVIEAENGKEALDILDQTPGISAVVSDFAMPGGVDGLQVTQHARKLGRIAKIVLMSGHVSILVQRGAPAVLQKPFTKDQLAAALGASSN
ncbi:PAS-domain containing protein [Limnohabitans sp. Bal53]|uniref:PAS-domain containing protein n=1 Tax=Limnohabitans sp. Bal53 TaxID=1977910 RepID=UPI000D3DB45B|nr:PAS-domain containing protein [Limnohabitans sp. Bal53]PUE40144.1 hybrid sensor histidine kinase/response regulator [Limnohabitans sp. Bal53]